MAELAIGAVTENEHTGTCVTPFNTNLHAGGSSGGSGVSVAAGWVPFSLGSDTMGSVRIPAAYCGVFGYKPSSQFIDRSGLTPLYPPMDTIGILANTIADIHSIMSVCSEVSWVKPEAESTTLLVPSFVQKSHSVVLSNFNEQISKIRNHANETGFKVIDLTFDLDLGALRRRGLLLCEFTGWKHFSEDGDIPEGISESVCRLLKYGADATCEKIEDAVEVLTRASESVSTLLNRFPENSMFILPVTPFPYPDLSATTEDLATSADFTCLANIFDLPAVSIPAARQAVQIMAKNGDDYRLLEMAEIISSICS